MAISSETPVLFRLSQNGYGILLFFILVKNLKNCEKMLKIKFKDLKNILAATPRYREFDKTPE